MEVLKADHLSKIYGSGENEVRALDDVSFYIQQGEFVAVLNQLLVRSDRPDQANRRFFTFWEVWIDPHPGRYIWTERISMGRTKSSLPYSGDGRWGLSISSTI